MKHYEFTEDVREIYPELIERDFTESQIHEVYRDIIDKEEYPDFNSWLHDMKKTSLIIEV